MYRKFYGLKEKPFHLVPNPQFLYPSNKHQNALTYLEYGLSEGPGFILLTGDIGSGKTTIIRHILNRIDTDVEVALISNTNVNCEELISLVLHEFGVEHTFDNKAKALEAVFLHLIEKYIQGKRVLLVIDEAQNLSIQALEEVRMLSNLQTDEHMLVQILLVGQPELRRKLQLPELSQLSQRIAVYYHLGPLERDELPEYIAFRLEKVGGSLEIFDPATFDLMYKASGGIPRVINLLCDTALVYGYADSLPQINIEVISQVIRDKDGFGLIASGPTMSGDVSQDGAVLPADALATRLTELEDKVAGLQQQIEQRTHERLVTELTDLLRQERERNDRLLFEYATAKARLDSRDDMEMDAGGESTTASLVREDAPPAALGPSVASGTENDGSVPVGSKKVNGKVYTRISRPEISMIDIHCHILPDIDDGPKDFDESMAMIRMAAADGIAAIVATPHLNDTLYSPVEVSRRVSWLNHLIRMESLPVTIMPGADISVQYGPEHVKGFTLNDTDYILLEFPSTHLPVNAGEIIGKFIASGYRPIITHPERNPTVIANPKVLEALIGTSNQCYVQVTSGSLTGEFGKDAQQCVQQLLHAGMVDVIASDAHSATVRKPLLSAGVRAAAEIVGAEAAQRMVFGAPVKIISGLAV